MRLGGEFGRSVLWRVANLGKGINETETPMLLAQHQWLESTDRCVSDTLAACPGQLANASRRSQRVVAVDNSSRLARFLK